MLNLIVSLTEQDNSTWTSTEIKTVDYLSLHKKTNIFRKPKIEQKFNHLFIRY